MQKLFRKTGKADGHQHTYNDAANGKTSDVNGHTHKYDITESETKEANGHTHSLPTTKSFNLKADITKVDEDQRLVYGWFSVIEKGGDPVIDLQGDIISEIELEKMAHQFVLNSRDAGEMHVRKNIGTLIESIVFTKEKQKALGIDLGKIGWFGGFFIENDDVWKKIKKGEYPAFSIGGVAERIPVDG